MRLTTKGRYAVTAMLDLALHARRGPVSLADISERQSISISYLEQLFAKLRKGGWFPACAVPAAATSWPAAAMRHFIAQIIDAVDELVDATRCAGQGDCQQGAMCLTHELWTDLSKQIHSFLSGDQPGRAGDAP
jgi:Rrf2 family iron-sulfur cluster assembly transcriptional regulator